MMLTKILKSTYFFILILGTLIGLLYLFVPSYPDHAAPLVAITAWVTLKQGLPLFHLSDAGNIYNLMYGPLVFMSHWPAFLIFGGSFFASKVTGVVLFGGILFLFSRLMRKVQPSLYRYIFAIYFLSWILGCDDFFFNNRADVFIFFWTLVAASIYWSDKFSPMAKTIALAAVAALCLNYKIHSVIYVAPFLGVLSLRSFRSFALTAVAFLIVAALPWLAFPHQFEIYVHILTHLSRAMGHTEIRQIVSMNLFATLILLSLFRPRFQNGQKLLGWFSILAIFLGSLFAMREGSGKNQMVPVMVSYLNLIFLLPPREFQAKYTKWIGVAVLYLIICMVKAEKDIALYLWQYSSLAQKKEEISELAQPLPEHSVLWMSSNGPYADSYLRPQIYFLNKGSAFIADVVTLMENDHGGIPFPQAASDLLASCQGAPYAIAVKGASYGVLTSFYRPVNIFPARWAEIFKEHYSPVKETEHYVLFQCH